MRRDRVIPALISFIVPVIFLYGLFFLVDVFESGFFALIYGLVIIVTGLMVFSAHAPGVRFLSPVQFKIFSFLILIASLVYVILALFFVTDLFSV